VFVAWTFRLQNTNGMYPIIYVDLNLVEYQLLSYLITKKLFTIFNGFLTASVLECGLFSYVFSPCTLIRKKT